MERLGSLLRANRLEIVAAFDGGTGTFGSEDGGASQAFGVEGELGGFFDDHVHLGRAAGVVGEGEYAVVL